MHHDPQSMYANAMDMVNGNTMDNGQWAMGNGNGNGLCFCLFCFVFFVFAFF
jgi:hypothetical protein